MFMTYLQNKGQPPLGRAHKTVRRSPSQTNSIVFLCAHPSGGRP